MCGAWRCGCRQLIEEVLFGFCPTNMKYSGGIVVAPFLEESRNSRVQTDTTPTL